MAPAQPTGWRKWGTRAMVVADWAGNHANNVGSKFGVERFWPTSGDYVKELEKCERILRMFTVEGVPTDESSADGKKKRRVFRKLPPNIIKDAKGLIIFTAMRSGIAPFSGAGGGGIIITRMSDGAWSPPSFISPNNFGTGLMLGLDVYNAILVLRTDDAVKGFRTHNLTLGSELGIAAGPLGGAGVSGEMGLKSPHKAPIFSYVQSRGFYAGVSLMGQAFLDRFDENERVYHWEGIKAGDIFDGKVRRPPESKAFYVALLDAETGAAQGANLEWDTDEVKAIDLEEGEVLRLPPTPDQLSEWEAQGIKDEEDVKFEESERQAVRALPPPPLHPRSKAASRSRPGSSASSIRSGCFSGANSPEMQAHDPQAHMTSPLSRGLLSPATAMSPPPPLPRRHGERKAGLGLSNSDEPEAQDREASGTLDLQHLSLDEKASQTTGASEGTSTSYEFHEETLRQPTPPPTFEDALTEPYDAPVEQSTGVISQTESLEVPPPLNHQDSASSVSVYSDATQEETVHRRSGETVMETVPLDGEPAVEPVRPHTATLS